MGRNKYPEETVAKILDVATRLFMERGYEHTSMQAIVDNLDGLTKGAVYHHFKSKDEVFEAAMARAMEPKVAHLRAIRDSQDLTGVEKLRALVAYDSYGTDTELFQDAQPSLDPLQNPRMLALEYIEAFELSAHELMYPVIEQGVADGTIATEYPQQLAEALCLLGNLWYAPTFYPAKTKDELHKRAAFLNELARKMGADIQFDSEAADRAFDQLSGANTEEAGK